MTWSRVLTNPTHIVGYTLNPKFVRCFVSNASVELAIESKHVAKIIKVKISCSGQRCFVDIASAIWNYAVLIDEEDNPILSKTVYDLHPNEEAY